MAGSGLGSGVEAMARRLVRHASKTIGACDSAGVTLVRHGRVTAGCCTDEVARLLDMAQYEAQEGPCLDAVRYLQVFNVAAIADVAIWPAFRNAAGANGIRSSLSIPLAHRGLALGMLNLYSRVPNGFEDCEELAMTLATRASAAVWGAESAPPTGAVGTAGDVTWGSARRTDSPD
jgi:GAF domain-containing protein